MTARARADERALLDEQLAYYRARAPEYDEWFLRQGRYDRGEAHRIAWEAEVDTVEGALRAARPRGRALELACGTGLWTGQLLVGAESVTAVDASPEVLRIHRERVASDRVRYVQADLFHWRLDAVYDFVFFGFWLSHVPPSRFEAFWSIVRAALAPGGTAFFVDNARSPEVLARDHAFPDEGSHVMERLLNDGRRFRVVKVYYEPGELEARLAELGWHARVRSSGEFFLFGDVVAA
ncbi:MAG TPA: class I SAM-dependent methyltransferase [Myxococcota bacterium]|nr:class I SAM-dependent methyltransferase [Myxococcota bacterium]